MVALRLERGRPAGRRDDAAVGGWILEFGDQVVHVLALGDGEAVIGLGPAIDVAPVADPVDELVAVAAAQQ